jgi:hypothetical protein
MLAHIERLKKQAARPRAPLKSERLRRAEPERSRGSPTSASTRSDWGLRQKDVTPNKDSLEKLSTVWNCQSHQTSKAAAKRVVSFLNHIRNSKHGKKISGKFFYMPNQVVSGARLSSPHPLPPGR